MLGAGKVQPGIPKAEALCRIKSGIRNQRTEGLDLREMEWLQTGLRPRESQKG